MAKKICVEPLSFGMTGFTIEELFSRDFVAQLNKYMPTAILSHFCISFSDSKDMVSVSHDTIEGKTSLDRVYVEGDGKNAEQNIKSMVEVLKKVFT